MMVEHISERWLTEYRTLRKDLLAVEGVPGATAHFRLAIAEAFLFSFGINSRPRTREVLRLALHTPDEDSFCVRVHDLLADLSKEVEVQTNQMALALKFD